MENAHGKKFLNRKIFVSSIVEASHGKSSTLNPVKQPLPHADSVGQTVQPPATPANLHAPDHQAASLPNSLLHSPLNTIPAVLHPGHTPVLPNLNPLPNSGSVNPNKQIACPNSLAGSSESSSSGSESEVEDRPPFSLVIQAKINQFEEGSRSKFFVTPRGKQRNLQKIQEVCQKKRRKD